MNKVLLVGIGKHLFPVPRLIWQRQIAHDARHNREHKLAFMNEDHRRVQYLVVTELPRIARPLSPAFIAEKLNLSSERIKEILIDLEEHMTFLYRNPQGEVTWAYPVTVDPTPHRITFSSGDQIYSA